jgi:hypothetical protein
MCEGRLIFARVAGLEQVDLAASLKTVSATFRTELQKGKCYRFYEIEFE